MNIFREILLEELTLTTARGNLVRLMLVSLSCTHYFVAEGPNIEITLYKNEKKVWWTSVYPGEAEIDVSKIEGSSHLDTNLLLRLRVSITYFSEFSV